MLRQLFSGSIDPLYFIYFIVSIVVALTVHEICHAYTAYFLGDSTAKTGGRLSLNPINHIDPFGFLALLVFGFGWAKPVMMNPYNFRNYRDGIMITALAGPFSNLMLAIIGAFVLKIPMPYQLSTFFQVFVYLNIVLASFNILPIPPLDGFKVFSRILPDNLYYQAESIERRYGFYIILFFLFTNLFTYLWTPVFTLFVTAVNYLTFSGL